MYDQVDGIAMGSPLAPTLANLFMGYNEANWLSEYTGARPYVYKRYVDDIFAVFENLNDASLFLNYLNSRHPNIKFTKEENKNGVLPFLDISISNLESFNTSVYHKSMYTGLLMNFKSFAPFEYKKRLVSTLLDRTFKINSSWISFDVDVKALCDCLIRNLFPSRFIDKCVRQFLNKKILKEGKEVLPEGLETRYITLPYIGDYSKVARNKVKELITRFCKENVNIKLVFTICKVKNYFSTKDPLPMCYKSNVVYSFVCARCHSCYVGRTHIHFDTRCGQHIGTDKNSSIFKHLSSNKECKNACSKDSFKILDNAKTSYELALKEGMHIKWRKPNLNIQKRHEIIKLLV